MRKLLFPFLITIVLFLNGCTQETPVDNASGGPVQYGECGDGNCDNGENTPSYPYYCPQDCS